MFLGGPSVTTGSVFYQSIDCSGAPYIGWVAHPTTMEPQAIVGPSATLFLGTSATPQTLSAASVLRPGAPCTTTSDTLTSSAIPATAVADLIPHFVPPFHIRSVLSPVALAIPASNTLALVVLAVALGLLGVFFVIKRAAA